MQGSQQALFFRHDTFLGVCEGLGQDFGFNPTYLRLALAVALLVAPVATFAGYVGFALLIALSRWLFPPRKAERRQEGAAPVRALAGDNDEDVAELATAA